MLFEPRRGASAALIVAAWHEEAERWLFAPWLLCGSGIVLLACGSLTLNALTIAARFILRADAGDAAGPTRL